MSDLHHKKPFKRGSFKDAAEHRPRHIRTPIETDAQVTDELTIDLVQVLASIGIHIGNVREIAKELVKKGWIRTKKVL